MNRGMQAGIVIALATWVQVACVAPGPATAPAAGPNKTAATRQRAGPAMIR